MKRIGFTSGLLVVVLSSFAKAGLYSVEEPLLVQVGTDGFAETMPFQANEATPFRLRINTAFNWINPNPTIKNPDRESLIQKVIAFKGSTPPEQATKAAMLLRLGKSAEALDLLAPLKRSRTPDFRVLANLAHIHALRGEWPEARRVHEEAILDAEMPSDLLPGIKPEQLKWLKRVEKDYYARWLRIREQREQDRVQRRSKPEEERIFPLFGELTFESNGYTPGSMPEAEKAKLPKDAIAIVQQLLLWEPNDGALYWLLGELFAAQGKLREALAVFDNCASESRQYSNRVVLMNHRGAVREAVAKLPPETSPLEVPLQLPTTTEPKDDGSKYMPSTTAWVVAGLLFTGIAVLMIYLKIRAARNARKWGYRD